MLEKFPIFRLFHYILWFKPCKLLSEIDKIIGGLGIKFGVGKAFGSFLAKQIAKLLAFLAKTSIIRPTLEKEIKVGGV